MNKKGEIIVVDDDQDDNDLIVEALKALGVTNTVACFNSASSVLDYLRKVDADPFFIISDLKMPVINGFELKQMIYADENLIKKAIPFILYSTTVDSPSFNTALSIGVQGFFVKPTSFEDLQDILRTTIDYMQKCMGN